MRTDVFITDGHWRKSLAAVRALGREGLSVTVGESTRIATAVFSRYCRHSVVYPSPLSQPEKFIDALEYELSRHPCRMVLPMEDETTGLVSQHRSRLSKYAYIPVVSHEKYRLASRKDAVLKIAREIGIPVPETWFIDDPSRIDRIKDSLPYPVVIKPRVGSGAVGIVYSNNADELTAHYLNVCRRFPNPLIQERLPQEGPGYGVSLLFDEKGTVKASFVHKRLREYPVTGGASTFRESTRHDEIRDMAVALMKKLEWFGVAMVEFKIDHRDGTPRLMEINPRFWGSLHLSIIAGVNFPCLLYRLSKGETFDPVERYTLGVRCRWMLPGDILHFIYNRRRASLIPDFFNFTDRNTSYDILSLSDPMPVLGRLMTPLTFLYDPDMKRRLKKRKL
ncbi:MAG: ATP-grasp domain-containing protein [Deltaproteobacteria bacterium]|nr:ATP-grasp domain-containing protein [Deltaproteobacteria bacterium]MBN2687025.1 ATP-grasp domain-containing protein [Deltaproteobacteria bacterium]